MLTKRRQQNMIAGIFSGTRTVQDALDKGMTREKIMEGVLVRLGSEFHFHETPCDAHIAEQVCIGLDLDPESIHKMARRKWVLGSSEQE